ncbi:hypothetical protein [Streptomyces lunalinharesii]|uniref:Integrase n=1 Tax=Streptomyces lunalinharesii TaxID=333384 RepID=A0ABN3R7Q0_9ACTN
MILSKTARHSALSTTANLYAHLTPRTAHQAVDAIATALNREEKPHDHPTTTSAPTRQHSAHSAPYGKAA